MKVREVIRRLERDGWFRVKSKSGHRQYKHPTKPGRVTVAGQMSKTLAPKTLVSIFRQAGWERGIVMRRYAIVVEDAGENLSAYVPDLPGCVAAADTPKQLMRLIREAIAMHLEGLEEDGLPIPEPTSSVEYVEIE